MNNYFVCKNGQNISWTSVCDGHNQCIDGSDERNCNYILIDFFINLHLNFSRLLSR
jgi:hypothetical protein